MKLSENQKAIVYALQCGFFYTEDESGKVDMRSINGLVKRGIIARDLNGYYLLEEIKW